MPRVLHLLPHPGGGAEPYLVLLEGLDGYDHERALLSPSRSRLRGAPRLVANLAAIARRRRDADLLHVHGDMASILAAPVLRGRPSLITTHGLHRLRALAGTAASPLVARALRISIRAVDATICTSGAEREELLALLPSLDPTRLHVVPNGVPVPPTPDPSVRAGVRAELGIGDDRVVLLYVGRLEDRKEPLVAVEAAERAAQGAPVVLLLAGDGPMLEAVTARRSDVVRPLGFRRDVDRLHAAADMFVLPSRREGMSIALLEAMALGLPPVVSDAPGNVEAVAGAGKIVPLGDVGALADAIAQLALDPQARIALAGRSRERVRGELSVERFLAGTREVYEAVLADRH